MHSLWALPCTPPCTHAHSRSSTVHTIHARHAASGESYASTIRRRMGCFAPSLQPIALQRTATQATRPYSVWQLREFENYAASCPHCIEPTVHSPMPLEGVRRWGACQHHLWRRRGTDTNVQVDARAGRDKIPSERKSAKNAVSSRSLRTTRRPAVFGRRSSMQVTASCVLRAATARSARATLAASAKPF